MTTNINTDLAARDRCTALAAQESLTEAEVYSIAIGVGLNAYENADTCRILEARAYRPLVVGDWTGAFDAAAVATAVTVSTDDATRVAAIADHWGVNEALVQSKALCTGLALLNGEELYLGPVLR